MDVNVWFRVRRAGNCDGRCNGKSDRIYDDDSDRDCADRCNDFSHTVDNHDDQAVLGDGWRWDGDGIQTGATVSGGGKAGAAGRSSAAASLPVAYVVARSSAAVRAGFTAAEDGRAFRTRRAANQS